MQPSTATTAAVLLVVVIAGCGGSGPAGPGGAGSGTPTVTPAPVPTFTLSPSAAGTPVEVVDLVALARTHYQSVFNTSYRYHDVHVVEAADGTVLERTEFVVDHNQSSHRYTITRTGAAVGGPVVLEYYFTATDPVVERVQTPNGTSYDRLTQRELYARLEPLPNVEILISHLAASSRNAVDAELRRVRRLDDSGAYRLSAERLERPDRFATMDGVDEPRNLTLTLRIHPSGHIEQYRLAYSATLAGREVRVSRDVTYASVGTLEVDRPSWYDRAVSNGSSGG